MKKISVLTLLMLLSLFSVEICSAQNRIQDINQSSNARMKIDDRKWNNIEEEAVNKKKAEPEVKTIVIKERVVVNDDKAAEQPKVEINNPCFEDMSVELVSLQGNKSSQEVTVTIGFTNHQVNKNVYIRDFLAFNEEGDKFTVYTVGSYSTLTDVAQKTSWKVGQMLPSKNSKLTAISFKIDGCVVEMRNLPIDWR